MVAAALKTKSAERLAQKRVILIDPEKRTLPPSVEELWAHQWFALYTAP